MRGNIGVGLWESLWQACENLLSVDLKYVGHKWNSSMLARILHKTPLNMMNYKTAALPSGLIHWVDWHAITFLNAYRHKHMSDITTVVVRTWFCTVVSFLNKLYGLSLSLSFPLLSPPSVSDILYRKDTSVGISLLILQCDGSTLPFHYSTLLL